MSVVPFGRPIRRGAAIGLLALLCACGALLPQPALPPSFYSLDLPLDDAAPQRRATAPSAASAPTLIVDAPQAAAGFDSPHMVYVRQPHQREFFAQSEWAAPPAHMLAPLVATAAARSGAFGAVVTAPSAAAADLRLATELIRLEQEFGTGPSRVRLTLHATLIDTATRRVLATREFDTSVASASEDARGGVLAAHQALRSVLDDLTQLCADVARDWTPPAVGSPRR